MNSHRVMYNGILKAFPHLSVVSEEDDPHPVDPATIPQLPEADEEVERVVGSKDILVPIEDIDVWIDPLDATQEYTENLRHYVTTMVCVAVKGKPVVGVIHKPFDDLTVWGWAGPNYVNPTLAKDVENNKVRRHRDLSKSRLIVSRSHAGRVHEVAEAAFGPDAEVTPAGGAGYKSWEVMKGTQDAYVHVTLIKKWDICAGAAILKALGGRLSTLTGAEVDYSGRGQGYSERNEGGVLATMHDHNSYVEALKSEAANVMKNSQRKKKKT